MTATLHLGNCLEILPTIADESIDSIVTDPPYGLGFMGKAWDALPPGVDVFLECLRVLKPGGHLIAFGGSRTYHRLACAVEDAGFEIRDQILWVYGSGFPKSLNVSKSFDKAAGAPATDLAKQWDGWGTALKPAHEPAVLARKPLCGTVAANVARHETGALNIDGCRVAAGDGYTENRVTQGVNTAQTCYAPAVDRRTFEPCSQGRFPANLIHDGSPEVLALFPETKSGAMKAGTVRKNKEGWAGPMPAQTGAATIADSGSAARFFYCAKASKKDRTEGGVVDNRHPTVKPTDLMAYLCRLVTPPGGTILDPFMGSGSAGKAAIREGFSFVGIEQDADSFATAQARIDRAVLTKGGPK